MEIKQKKTLTFEELVAMDQARIEEERREAESMRPATKSGGSRGPLLKKSDNVIEGQEVSPNDRYYLPVLDINHVPQWESKPMEERRHFTDKVALETCLGNCCGVPGLKGGCCHLDPVDLEHVLGPVDEKWIADTIKWFGKKGLHYKRGDLVIDYEEGKILGETLFKDAHNNQIFKEKTAYPFLRFQVLGPRYVCKFMNPETYMCQIYAVRPNMCRTYLCQYVVTNFLVKTKAHPGSYRRVR